MNSTYKVIAVHPLEGFILHLVFANGESRYFEVSPYLDKGIFKELKDVAYFNRVHVRFDGVAWPNDQDLSPDTLYMKGAAQPMTGVSRR